jgi:hypothetical protein
MACDRRSQGVARRAGLSTTSGAAAPFMRPRGAAAPSNVADASAAARSGAEGYEVARSGFLGGASRPPHPDPQYTGLGQVAYCAGMRRRLPCWNPDFHREASFVRERLQYKRCAICGRAQRHYRYSFFGRSASGRLLSLATFCRPCATAMLKIVAEARAEYR